MTQLLPRVSPVQLRNDGRLKDLILDVRDGDHRINQRECKKIQDVNCGREEKRAKKETRPPSAGKKCRAYRGPPSRHRDRSASSPPAAGTPSKG